MTDILVRAITATRFKDVEALFMTDSIMRSCWDIWPRYAGKADRAAIDARHRRTTQSAANRAELRALAGRRRAPGLLAYEDKQPVGFISLGPLADMRRTAASRATPRIDAAPVWVVPCFFVQRGHRGRGVTVALLRAAVEYAGRHGAPAVEGYPRAPGTRVDDSTAFFGTADQFRRAGFRKIAGPKKDLPKGWVPRYTMRAQCSSTTSRQRPAR